METIWIKDGNFIKLNAEEIKGLSDEELIAYSDSKSENSLKGINDAIEGMMSKDDFEVFKKELADKDTDAKFKAYDEAFIKLQKQIKDNVKGVSKPNEFRKNLTEVAKSIKEARGSVGYKAVGTMAVSTNVTGQMPQAEREAGFNNVVRQAFTIRNGSNVYPINSTLAEWVEQSGIEGSAGMTAEGTAKTQLDWNYTVANASVKKITSYVKITEEMLGDIDGMMGEINGNLAYQIGLLEEAQLITGDGLTVNLNGIEKYAGALDLAPLNLTVENANNWDVLGACITQIKVNAKATANRIFMNPADVFLSIHGTKDTTNDYINPVTVVPNNTPGGAPSVFVWGVPVVESDSVTAGEYIVADMTKFTIRDKEGLRIEIGLDADDFTKNLVTIRGEKRLVSYIKANDVEAFVTGTFVAGKAFLETA